MRDEFRGIGMGELLEALGSTGFQPAWRGRFSDHVLFNNTAEQGRSPLAMPMVAM